MFFYHIRFGWLEAEAEIVKMILLAITCGFVVTFLVIMCVVGNVLIALYAAWSVVMIVITTMGLLMPKVDLFDLTNNVRISYDVFVYRGWSLDIICFF